MRSILAMSLTLALVGCGGSSKDAANPTAAGSGIAYHETRMVRAAPVLTDDPTSGRCADASQPCYKDNNDALSGQHDILRIEDIAWGAQHILVQEQGDLETFVGSMQLTANSGPQPGGGRATSLSGSQNYAGTSPPALVSARLFDSDRDVVVTALAGLDLSVVVDSKDGLVTQGTGATRPSRAYRSFLYAAKGPFVQGGLDAVAFATAHVDTRDEGVGATLQVIGAADTRNPATGLKIGPPLDVFAMKAVAVGNFFGTGPVIVSAVPTDTTVTLYYYAVDSSTLALNWIDTATLRLTRPAGARAAQTMSVSMAAGRFNTLAYDQLLIAVTDDARTDLLSVDTGDNGLPVQRLSAVSAQHNDFRAVLRAGRFDWSSPFDSVAYMLTDRLNHKLPSVPSDERVVLILGLDENLDVVGKAKTAFDPNQCLYDMQVGNFDRRQKDPRPNAPPDATISNPNLQLVFASSGLDGPADTPGECSGGAQDNQPSPGLTISVWDVVVGSDGGLTIVPDIASISYTGNPALNGFYLEQLSLAVPDLQGRSLRLGTPQIITVERRTQPSVIVAAPPMHADWIDGQLRNFSMAPGGFSVTYNNANTQKVQTTTKHTTTWSWGAEEKFDAKVSQGPCGLVCEKAEFKASAKQALDGANAATKKTYRSLEADVSVATGQFDVVWFHDSSLTLYVYPVLGRTVCRGGADTCDPADRVPMTLTIAAPDTITNLAAIDASALTWYQPTWMPGNLLSYPGTLGQLQAATTEADGLFQLVDPLKFNTGTDDIEQTLQWKIVNTDGTTTTMNQNYSFKASVSVSTSWGIKAISSGSVGFEVSTGGSFGFKDLSDSQMTLSGSTGLKFEKQAVFASASRYRYDFSPYVFSDVQPLDAQSVPAGNAPFGLIYGGYVVDLLSQSAGTIWSDSSQLYSRAPDVGFNQPLRFKADPPLLAPAPGDVGCLSTDGTIDKYDCVEMSESKPENPYLDDYHHMRGFFVTDPGANGGGPQLSTINAGQPVLLQARVHNFSLKDMPPGSIVRVSFYLMRWDTSTQTPIGDSVYLGTGQTDPVSRWRNDSDSPNWRLVRLPFNNTVDYQDQDVVFWVVTWIEDASGNLVAELPGKGLKQIPTLEGLEFAEAAQLEEEHGNNVGFYNQVFHVFAPSTGATAAVARIAATKPSAQMTHSGADKVVVRPGERARVGTRVLAGENHLPSGLRVDFYDGNPRVGGRAIGTRVLPHLRSGAIHEFIATFRSTVCGPHEIHALAGPGTRFEHHAIVETITVDCRN
jgi:hypothetical protein